MEELNLLRSIFRDTLGPVIAIITAYIAYQQYKANRMKLKYELYDKRYKVFEKVKHFLSTINGEAGINNQDLLAFKPSVIEAAFLFGKDMNEYLVEIYKHAVELHKINGEYRDFTQKQPEGYDHSKISESIHKELTWFSNQYDPMKKIFNKYLNVSKI